MSDANPVGGAAFASSRGSRSSVELQRFSGPSFFFFLPRSPHPEAYLIDSEVPCR